MPPRIPRFPCLRSSQAHAIAATPITFPFRPFLPTATSRAAHVSAADQRKAEQQRKRRAHDPYIKAQAQARRAANLSRQEVLRKQRAAAYGDPVRGIITPFVESFDTAGHREAGKETVTAKQKGELGNESGSEEATAQDVVSSSLEHLKHFLSKDEVDEQLEESYVLSTPAPDKALRISPLDPTADGLSQGTTSNAQEQAYKAQHDNAAAAISRIVSLATASSADRRHANIQRCVDVFGRHATDTTLPSRPLALPAIRRNHPDPAAWVVEETMKAEERRASGGGKMRAGPDTGSSEVQIAILTAKIRALAGFLETRGKGDKVNKRNLRLLVHRRQKLLKYLWRKEKGGPRWQHCIGTLGITEGAWKGEISL